MRRGCCPWTARAVRWGSASRTTSGPVERGIDMMDCVLPSRSGRTGQAWTRWGQVIAPMLLTWHNLHYFQELMQNLRDSVAAGRLASFAGVFRGMQARGDVEPL